MLSDSEAELIIVPILISTPLILPGAMGLGPFLPRDCWSLRSCCAFWKGLTSFWEHSLHIPELKQTLLKQMLLASLVGVGKPYGKLLFFPSFFFLLFSFHYFFLPFFFLSYCHATVVGLQVSYLTESKNETCGHKSEMKVY